MTPERWQQIKALLESAMEREGDERVAFLSEACAGDEPLRREVESFIISHERAGSFIESPAFEVMADMLVEDPSESVVGGTLGHYKVLAELGRGGMGEVYLAEDTRLNRPVALKLLPAEFTGDENRVRRFQQEARAASALNHPNIVTIYEIGQFDSRLFIATEYIEGSTLREQMMKTEMKSNEALDIAIQAASALATAHEAGIVHRDIKPDNIMIRADGYVKVLDFGLAKLTERKTGGREATTLIHTRQGMVMGTAHYMSPEQARGLPVDARTDIFSLGVVLYEMVAGRTPFEGETMMDVLASILTREPAPLASVAPEMPAELQQIVSKSLSKDRESRYQTTTMLLAELKSLKQRLEFEMELERSAPGESGGSKVKAARPSNLRGELQPPQRKRRFPKSKDFDSLAVLPLVNAGADPEMEYFSDGVTESIINALSQVPKLRVVARSTVFRYKGREIDPQEVGRQLGVRAVLTGRVRQAGDGLMIAAELIDVKNDSQLWGEHYNRELSDIFEVQEEIAHEISEKLRLRLTREQKKHLTKRYTENAAAYQLYLKGRYFWYKRTEEALRKSIGYFNQAIEEDPSYAAAYDGLSDSYTLLALRGLIPPKEALLKAKAAARKALEIDDTLGEAYASLAHVRLHDWDWSGLEDEFKRALELSPGHAIAYHWYSEYLMAMGRADESIAIVKQAQEIEPLSPVVASTLGFALLQARKYDEAIEQFGKGLELDPNHFQSHYRLGHIYSLQGRHREAVEEALKSVTLSGRSTETLAGLGQVYAAAGMRAEAQQVLDELVLHSKERYISPYNLAKIYAALGDKEQALHWLEKGYEEHNPDFIELKVEPALDVLRPDPRFTELVRRIGLNTEERPRTAQEAMTGGKDLKRRLEVGDERKHSASPASNGESRRVEHLEQEIRFCTTSDSVRIAYATVGKGPPLVKAANWLNHLEFDWHSPIWRHLFEEFARDHFLVRYDERGNGLSDWNIENLSFEAMVQDLEAVADAVGLVRFPILGISQGGPVAIAYAVRHPEKVSHLILYGSYARGWAKRGGPGAEELERRHAYLTLTRLGWGQDNPAFRQLWTSLFLPDATLEQWHWFNDLQRITTSPENAFRILSEFGQIDVTDLLPQVKVPTLVLHCRNESVAPFEEGRLIAALIPGARFVPLEGRNHLLLESEPAWAKFITEVRRFLGEE